MVLRGLCVRGGVRGFGVDTLVILCPLARPGVVWCGVITVRRVEMCVFVFVGGHVQACNTSR